MSSQNDEEVQRFYCHQCNATCVPEAPEFVCPTCNDGFIEPYTRPAPLPRPPPGLFPMLSADSIGLLTGMHGLLEGATQGMQGMQSFAGAMPVRPGQTTNPQSSMPSTTPSTPAAPDTPGPSPASQTPPPPTTSSSSPFGQPANPSVQSSSPFGHPSTGNPLLDSVLGQRSSLAGQAQPRQPHTHRVQSSNVSPNSTGGFGNPLFGGGAGRVRFVLGDGFNPGQDGAATDIPTLFSMIMSGLGGGAAGGGGTQPLHGNPGDYAWGPAGLDNIISQLIGQLDGSGPAPAQEQAIDSLPEVFVPKKQIDNKLDCTVCQEFFVEDVKVRQLPCNHYFHTDCIVPWLKLHNSCPVCRVSIDPTHDTSTEDVDMPSEGVPDLEDAPGTAGATPQQPQSAGQRLGQPTQSSTSITEDDLD